MTSNEFSKFLRKMINDGHNCGYGIVSDNDDEDDFIDLMLEKYGGYIEGKHKKEPKELFTAEDFEKVCTDLGLENE